MRLSISPIRIEESDSFKCDLFDRKPFGEALTRIVKNSDDELVISIDGKWGEGKTTFAKMWQGLLLENGIPSIYIDAFQHDYTEDAFISIASTITSYIEEHSVDEESKSNFTEKAKKVGAKLLPWSAKLAIKAASLGIVKEADLESLSEIAKDATDDISEKISNIIKERLESHKQELETIQEFRKTLSEIPSKIKGGSSNKLVLIIDELDRCKPSFAVEIIEKVKHLFSVKNVTFVLIMHKSQLEEAIRCIYGEKIDAHTYMQKFITIETAIPKNDNNYKCDIKTYSKALLNAHEINTFGDKDLLLDYIGAFSRKLDISLRQLEKSFTNLTLIYSSITERTIRIPHIIAFVCIVKSINPNLYSRLSKGEISFSEICKELKIQPEEFSKSGGDDLAILSRLFDWVKFVTLSKQEYEKLDPQDRIRNFERTLWDYGGSREGIIKVYCNVLNMFRTS